ncbi:hypothetical protein [uncultured Cohaesibacter sp.]|nr:hypothetical protein [uncultured Cohaesibacter sp.]
MPDVRGLARGAKREGAGARGRGGDEDHSLTMALSSFLGGELRKRL